MRTRGERIADNHGHVRDAVTAAGSLPEARKLLREAGFEFRARLVRAAWDSTPSEEPGSLFDEV